MAGNPTDVPTMGLEPFRSRACHPRFLHDILYRDILIFSMTAPVSDKLTQFFSRYKLLSYQKGEMIFQPEDTLPGVLFIKKGIVKLYSISSEGKELTLNIFKPGSYFSMMWALGGIPNTYYFQAMTEVEVWRAPKDAVIAFLKQEPEELFEFTRRIVVGLSGILTRMDYLLSGNARLKISSVLLSLAKRFGEEKDGKGILIQLSLTHQDVASLAGLTRETTSLELEKLEKTGMIEYEKHLLKIISLGKLEQALLIEKAEESFPPTL